MAVLAVLICVIREIRAPFCSSRFFADFVPLREFFAVRGYPRLSAFIGG
jgi:hypothetical protein